VGTAEGERLAETLRGGFDRIEVPGPVTEVELMQLKRLGEEESLAFRIDVREGEGIVRTVVVTRLFPEELDGKASKGRGHKHRRTPTLAGKYWVGAVEAPISPEWTWCLSVFYRWTVHCGRRGPRLPQRWAVRTIQKPDQPCGHRIPVCVPGIYGLGDGSP